MAIVVALMRTQATPHRGGTLMYPIDRDSFRSTLNDLAVTFGKDLTPELEALYFEALRDVPLSAVQACAARVRRHGRFFPKPFELRPREDFVPAAPMASADDGWRGDAWDAAANLHFLRYVRARLARASQFFGVPGTPEHRRRVLRFCVWKAAWAADMRDREVAPTPAVQKAVWTDLMRRAEAEMRGEAA